MKYELHVVMPVSSKYADRLKDFKRYGLINLAGRKVLLSLVTSGGDEIEGLGEGWAVDTKIVRGRSESFPANVYRHFLECDIDSKWFAKVDDDSCTDVGGLMSNLEEFYDHEEKYYLAAALRNFVGGSPERHLVHEFSKFMGAHARIIDLLQHEMEFCVVSAAAMQHIRSHGKAASFLGKRCELLGGASDVSFAVAAAISKIYPVNFPFATYLPLLDEFSLTGGLFNHIHMVARTQAGDNFHAFERMDPEVYEIFTKMVDGTRSELERSVSGSKYILENDRELRMYYFGDLSLKIKFEDRALLWHEKDGEIHVFRGRDVVHRLKPEGDCLREGDFILTRI
jgi:hypothetical protein